jgi:hypothetical protein
MATSKRIATAMLCALAGACGSGGVGESSSAPGAPQEIAATGGDGEVTLSWSAVAGALAYTIYWDTHPGVTPATGTPIAPAASPYVHQGVTNGQVYYYVVVAVGEGGVGPASAEVSAVPLRATSAFDPAWASAPASQTLQFEYEPGLGSAQNGEALRQAIVELTPGQRLEIGAGTYSIATRFDIVLSGTANAPIRIVAKAGTMPVITRPEASENTINIGSGGPARYVQIAGLEIRGGDTAIKIYDAEDVWIDRCHIHHCGGAGIAANSADTRRLTLTRNEINDTGGTAEGMYLGANNGQFVTTGSVIAQNHIHDTRGTQGDGIELKQGSWGNRIVENLIHGCQYPCITVYGTGGKAVNVIERNTCYDSDDNVVQVQGEAIVRNNLIMAGSIGFHSHDHQGSTRDLTVVHNTIVNTGRATDLVSWNNRAGMVFANNVVYSLEGQSISFPNGATGVTVLGNVVVGPVSGVTSGFTQGLGLTDFVEVTWGATARNARPSPAGAMVGAGNAAWAVAEDITGAPRTLPLDAGCYDAN